MDVLPVKRKVCGKSGHGLAVHQQMLVTGVQLNVGDPALVTKRSALARIIADTYLAPRSNEQELQTEGAPC